MPTILVMAGSPGAGKTGVAAAIARAYAYAGTPARLVRVAGDDRAAADAAFFGSLDFVPGSLAAPVERAAIPAPGDDGCVVVELPAGETDGVPGATVVFVSRGEPGDPPGGAAAHIITNVPPEAVAGFRTEGEPRRIVLAEDRTLAGFTIEDVSRILTPEVLVEGELKDTSCDHLVIAPIASDAGEPYFRRFGSFAVVVRFDRTDMHLAAIKGGANFLILTGGRRPMEYLFDVARAESVPVLLSRNDTENTVIALEAVFDQTRFSGERKLDRMTELLASEGLFEALPGLSVPAAT